MADHDSRVSIDLRDPNFTPSGSEQLEDTVDDYFGLLILRAKGFAELGRVHNSPLEITSEHVRSAARQIAYIQPAEKPKWLIPVQVLEYVGVAIFGIGTGHQIGRAHV